MTNFIKILVLASCLTSCGSKTQDSTEISSDTKNRIAYWNIQRKGTNYFNQTPSKEWFDAASMENIKFVRLVFEKWDGEQRDFILGNADDYQGIVESDFQQLINYLDYADELNIKVVITPISLPGDRWTQSNNDQKDGRIWKELKYREEAIQYWKDLAFRLKDHPAVVGYNLVNEPHPEIYFNKHSFWKRDLHEWFQTVEGGPADLNLFNKQMVQGIRTIDTEMPIIIESGLYATPWAFDYLMPIIEDDKIIYSFHMYEPYSFVTKRLNDGRYSYPGEMPIEELDKAFDLNKVGLSNFFKPMFEWTAKYKIPNNRIWVSEFGCDRSIEGAKSYLSDLITIFNENNWHWSFYAFREDDGFQAMDYELGKHKVHYTYWEYQEAKTMHLHYDKIYSGITDSFWDVFQKELN